MLSGDENAILDFRGTTHSKLTYYFDHHQTGLNADEHRTLLSRLGPERVYFEPAYSSCSKLIADVLRAKGHALSSSLETFVLWADKMDTARFDTPEEACDDEAPLNQLAAVVERHADAGFITTLVPELLRQTPEELVGMPYVQERWGPLRAGRENFARTISERATLVGSVVVSDLSDKPVATTLRFHPYVRFPDAVYSVGLYQSAGHFKLSVGYNPWTKAERRHNIGQLCIPYGGGGHPAVGSASFQLSSPDKARQAMGEIVSALNA